jgi:hypothetical protein
MVANEAGTKRKTMAVKKMDIDMDAMKCKESVYR